MLCEQRTSPRCFALYNRRLESRLDGLEHKLEQIDPVTKQLLLQSAGGWIEQLPAVDGADRAPAAQQEGGGGSDGGGGLH